MKVGSYRSWLVRSARTATVVVCLLLLGATAYSQESRNAQQQTIQFKSELVGQVLPYDALLPVGYAKSNKRYPVLYLLHGLFGRHDDWLTRTNLAAYAAQYELIIITPEGHDRWYVDSATKPQDKYESYFIQELIADVDTRFRTIKDRRARGIAGLSMGGYGALKFGVKHRNYFVFAGSLSGALDAAKRTADHPGFAWDILRPSIVESFGPAGSPTRAGNDLHELARNATDISALPYLYLDCGLEDGFLRTNAEFAEILVAKKIPHQYRQLPGKHSWEYWDRQVQEILRLYAELTARAH